MQEIRDLLSKDERSDLLKGVIEEFKDEAFEFRENGAVAVSDRGTYLAVDQTGEIIYAVITPTNLTNALDTLDTVKDWDLTGKDQNAITAIVRKAAKFGILANAVETIVDLPTYNGWYLAGIKDEEIKRIYKEWLLNIGGMSLEDNELGGIAKLSQSFLNRMIIDGDWIGSEVWDRVDIGEKKGLYLPTNVREYDITTIKLVENALAVDKEEFELEIDSKIIEIINNKSDEANKPYYEYISDYIKDAVEKDGKQSVIIPSEIALHFSRKKTKKSGFGDSYILRAVPAVAIKERLRALEHAIITGLIQRTIVITVGHKDPQSPLHVAKKPRVELARQVFSNLKPNNLLVWSGSDLGILDIVAGREQILGFSDRHKDIDRDILSSIGLPEALLFGSVGRADVDIKLFVKTISMLTNLMDSVGFWINKKIRQVAELNKFGEYPRFMWRSSGIYDTEFTLKKVKAARELNLIGIKMFHNLLGDDADLIIEDYIEEGQAGLADKLPLPYIPYQGNTPDDNGQDIKDVKVDDDDLGEEE